MSAHPDAELASDAMKIAAAVRGGRAAIEGVIFHSDRGSTYTANGFMNLCRRLGYDSRWDALGSCFDNAASEAFFSTLEHEVSPPGATSSTTPDVGTAQPGCYHPSTTRKPRPSDRRRHNGSLHVFQGKPCSTR
ncbi:integrase catalytic subunit [Mycobacterium haemophilum DSM 44634]|nr:DDE-type integrase/transposase/recombinase [Mycobacterium haemophilum DSM 44634]